MTNKEQGGGEKLIVNVFIFILKFVFYVYVFIFILKFVFYVIMYCVRT